LRSVIFLEKPYEGTCGVYAKLSSFVRVSKGQVEKSWIFEIHLSPLHNVRTKQFNLW